jgi:hypothetical protein
MSARAFETVGDLAAATIDVLDERGWCQVSFRSPDGRVCLVEAVNEAIGAGHLPYDHPAYEALRLAIVDALPGHPVDGYNPWPSLARVTLYGWNDRDETSVEDVRLALKHASLSTEPCPDLTIEAAR